MKEHDAVEAAMENLTRNGDGSFDEKALIEEIARLIDFDTDAERRNKATRVVRRQKMPGFGCSHGQLTLPGIDPYAYEPDRLIANAAGRIVEQAQAWPEFKRAEADRARAAAARQQAWATRKSREYKAFAAWALAQTASGRSEADLTFGAFVRESGVWSPGQAEPEPDPSAEDAGP